LKHIPTFLTIQLSYRHACWATGRAHASLQFLLPQLRPAPQLLLLAWTAVAQHQHWHVLLMNLVLCVTIQQQLQKLQILSLHQPFPDQETLRSSEQAL
jgi:hypothetical protein